jgi:serine/threonine-protein kinase
MLTGQLPFTAQSSIELARLHRTATPQSPRELNPALSPDLERIILKVLSKEPSARYRTADQLGRVLITFTEKPPRPKSRQRSPLPPERKTPQSQAKPQTRYQPRPQIAPQQEISKPIPKPRSSGEIDWITTILGLTALIAVGGLAPFFLWVYYAINNVR